MCADRNIRRLFLLGGARLTDIGMSHIAAMKRLEWLTIREGRLGAQTLAAIAQLDFLETLNLSSVNEIPSESFFQFVRLSRLQQLVLQDCRSFPNAAVAAVSHVTLEKLSITNAQLISRVDSLSICTNLKSLNLNFSSLSDFALKFLSSLSHLEELSLDGLPLSGEGLSAAKYSLKSLSMRCANITREGAMAIAQFTQ